MSVATEKHYTVKEIAQLWNKSEDYVRRLLKDVTGVLRSTNAANRGRRTYSTITVPESVLNALHARPVKARNTKKDNKPLPRTTPVVRQPSALPSVPMFDPSDIMDSLTYEAGIVLNGKDPYETDN